MAGPPGCDPSCACSGNEFGEAAARRSLRSYRRSGPPGTTAWLIDGLRAGGIDGHDGPRHRGRGGGGPSRVAGERCERGNGRRRVAGLRRGRPSGVRAAGHGGSGQARGRRLRGPRPRRSSPPTSSSSTGSSAAIPTWRRSCRLSVAHSRRRYGLVYPRDLWWIRAGSRIMNAFARLARQQVRAHVHSTAAVDAIVRAAGFAPLFRRTNTFWQVVVYERAA